MMQSATKALSTATSIEDARLAAKAHQGVMDAGGYILTRSGTNFSYHAARPHRQSDRHQPAGTPGRGRRVCEVHWR